MRGSRVFCQSYFVLNLFYGLQRGSNGFIDEKTILIQEPRGGPLFSKGGGGCQTFSRGGGGPNANFFRNPCTYLLFSRGEGVRTPYPPMDPHIGNVIITGQYLSQSRF